MGVLLTTFMAVGKHRPTCTIHIVLVAWRLLNDDDDDDDDVCSYSFVHCTVDWFVRSTPFCRLIRALFVLTSSNNVLNIFDRSKFSCKSCCPWSPCAGSFTTVNKSLHYNKMQLILLSDRPQYPSVLGFFTFQKNTNNIKDINDIAFPSVLHIYQQMLLLVITCNFDVYSIITRALQSDFLSQTKFF